jgi:hypothetical protein
MSYGQDVRDFFRRTAVYVDKIVKGAKPADLPVEQPTKFKLVLNLKTANALGLTFPQSLILSAGRDDWSVTPLRPLPAARVCNHSLPAASHRPDLSKNWTPAMSCAI